MAEINWTRESEVWLRDIYDYIALDDADAAARTIANIYDKAQHSKIIRAWGIDTNPSNHAKSAFFFTITTA